MTRDRMRRFAFLALFAVLLAALAPTVSYAVAAGNGQPVVQMCTSFGLQNVPTQNDAGDTIPSQGDQAGKQCPFCLFHHAATFFQLPQPAPVSAATVVAVAVPPIREATFDPSLAWLAILNHAPPALS